MQKVRIVGLQSQKDKIVKEMHRLGAIEIRKSNLEMEDDKPGELLPQISESLVQFNSAKAILDNYLKNLKKKVRHQTEAQLKTNDLLKAARDFEAVSDTVALEERRVALENEIAKIDAARTTAAYFVGSGIDFSQLKSNILDFGAYLLTGKARKLGEKQIAEQKKVFEVIENKTKTGTVLFIAYKKEDPSVLEKLEHTDGARKLDISNEYLDSTAEKVVARLEKLKAQDEKEKKGVIASLQKHAQDDYPKIMSMLEMLSVEVERASASIGFKKTNSTFVVEGWVPKRIMLSLNTHLNSISGEKVAIEEIDSDELAPTLFRRSKFLRPFYKIMEFFSLPRSDELDPTLIFILSFPIFYGFMVSDVGYGIASLLFATFIVKISDPDDILYNVAKLWQISSIAVIFFGFLSNQYFGYQLNQYFTSFTGFDWLKDTPTILGATVIFGIVQVVLGLFFSFINSYHHGHRKIAVSKLTSITVVIFGTIAVGGSLFHLFGSTLTAISTGIAILALLLTIALSGSEAVEVISLVSHPLSYARIMGFGLASVILALLIDKTFAPSLSSGLLGFSLSLIIFILLHFVNMLLGTFEGLVQGVRLNFVEFFSKFYTGGGIKFKPFFYKRRYTKEM